MRYTLGEASRAAGVSKATISRAIGSGKLSAERVDGGRFAIDAAELARVFHPKRAADRPMEQTATGLNGATQHPQQATIELLERERAQLLDQVADLRRRLDEEASERRRLTAVIADQRTSTSTDSRSVVADSARPRRRWWPWRR